ncbi:MAG: TasA family protein, partial [Halobaculum sp.]
MTDDTTTFELTRRRVLGGALTVGAASAATGAGTLALFSDTEQSSGNTVSAGTLDLTADGDDDATTTLSVGGSTVEPGASGSGATTLSNAGSIDGFANFDVSTVQQNENGQTEPERPVDNSGGDPGTGSGELGGLIPDTWSTLDVRYGFDTTGDGNIDVPVVSTFGKTYEP